MDGLIANADYLQERRRRLAAERMLVRTRHELTRAHSALVANADRLSRDFLSTREENLRLTDRQKKVLAERKEAADKADRSRRRLWHALEAMRDGFALFDGNNKLIAANSVYLGLFDSTSEIAPGASAEDLFGVAADEGAFDTGELEPEDWAQSQVQLWEQDPIAHRVLHTFDGRAIRFQDRRAPDGDLVSLAVDITDIEARESNLAAARDAAEETAKAKAAFLARMSHEMRTPMNGVLGLAEMLADRDLDDESKEFARTIRDSAEALLTIVNDTLDVSKIEAEKVELRSELFDLEALLIDCLRLAGAARRDSAVELVLSYPLTAPTHVVGDEGRLRQIVMNLLGNALKFTDQGHVILRTTLSIGADNACAVSIMVDDTGPGIPADERDQVFEAFGQVENGRPQKEGTGLGLTISKGLAERMGGTIRILDKPTPGTVFELTAILEATQNDAATPSLPAEVFIPEGTGALGESLASQLASAGCAVHRGTAPALVPTLLPVAAGVDDAALPSNLGQPLILFGASDVEIPPLAAQATANLPPVFRAADLCAALTAPVLPAAMDPSPPAAAPRARPLLLIADDNATNRFLLEKMLGSEDFDLRLVEDGAQAVAAYQEDHPDVVLLDISMPVLDGFGAAAQIQDADRTAGRPATPLIALTAHTGEEMSQQLQDAGFLAHQTKPVRKADLLDAIAEALTLH